MAGEQNREMIRTHIRRQFGLADEQIEELLPSFLDTLSGYIEELETAFAEDDREAVGRVSHTTKGALLNLGLHDQAGLAKDIELRTRAGENLMEVKPTFKSLKIGLDQLLD
jgi:HPt (histidine-containing phosphotransfer) domain-containing protein